MKYGKSPTLCQKAIKTALESFFFLLKVKNGSNHLIGMVGMIDPLSSILPPSSNSMRCLKKIMIIVFVIM